MLPYSLLILICVLASYLIYCIINKKKKYKKQDQPEMLQSLLSNYDTTMPNHTGEYSFTNTYYEKNIKSEDEKLKMLSTLPNNDGIIVLAHCGEDGHMYYYKIKIPKDVNVSNMHNHQYRFIYTSNNTIPKKNLMTGETQSISMNSPEYKLVHDIRYNQIKELFKDSTMFEKSTTYIDFPMRPHNIFIMTHH